MKFLFIAYAVVWALLGIQPMDRSDWLLENILVFAALPFLWSAYRREKLTPPAFTMIIIFLTLHTIGSHYTYSEVPAGRWVSEWLGGKRNHYDRLVHFLFGFLMIRPFYETISHKLTASRKLRLFLCFSIIVMSGAVYEIMEWLIAIIVDPKAGNAFLGSQGDQWDAQKDLTAKSMGAILGSLLLILIAKFTANRMK